MAVRLWARKTNRHQKRFQVDITGEENKMSNIEEAVEMLRCAEVNCDNVPKVHGLMALIIKAQIQDAIKTLGGEIVTEDVLAPYREQEASK